MATTFHNLNYHIIFSTKGREPFIRKDLETRVWNYIGGVARVNKCESLIIGGVENHIHALLRLPADMAVSKAVQLIKGGTSKWINDEKFMQMRFAWQNGYGAFTVSKSNVEDVYNYIHSQRTHHETRTFEDEYRAFMLRHDIMFEEKHLFD
ncbi:MAG: IS200/IS605 family transposase [Verrucomicrobiota bacterium]|nr:IS200/IS605 family transposase [Verrucomicrobiota bacterium]